MRLATALESPSSIGRFDGRKRPALVRYGLAVLFVLASLLISLWLTPFIYPTPFLLFFPAVIGTAWIGGLRPGLLATALASLLVNYFLLPPYDAFNLDAPSLIRTGAFAMIVGTVCWFAELARNQFHSRAAHLAELHAHDQFRTLADSIPQLCWMANPDGWVFWYNQRWYDYTGANPEQMEGWGWQSVHDPEELPKVLEPWRASIQTGKPFDMVFPLRGADGVFRPFLTRIMPVKDPEGKVVRWFGTNTDISEQKRAEEALRVSEEFNRRIIQSSFDCIAVLDREGRLLYLSPGGQQLRELTDATTLLGESWVDFWKGDDRKHAATAIATANAGGTATFQGFSPTSSGTPKWWDVVITPIRDANGNVERLLSISRDVTQHEQAEEALRESEAHFRSLFENMLEGFAYCKMLFDDRGLPVDFVYLDVNTAFGRLTGLKDVIGRKVTEVIPGIRESQPELFEAYGRVVLTGQPERFEVELKSLGMWFAISVYSPEKEHFVAVFDVITDRKLAEQALLRSEKLATVGRLAATVAHEINNPLQAVSSLLYVAEHNPSIDEAAREHLRMAGAELTRAAHIAKQTLAFSKGGAAVSRFRPADVLESVLALLERKLRNKEVICEKESSGQVEICAVESEIRQIFWNLLSNSLDAVPAGGRIKLRVSPSRRNGGVPGVRVTVADNGSGIGAEHMPHLFEPFFTTKETGNGLGLWITREIVKKHGGSIRVRSRNRNGASEPTGTVFSIFLPAEATSVGEMQFVPAPEHRAQAAKKASG